MKTFFSEDHRRHFPQAELSSGQFVTPFERPARVEYVLERLRGRDFSTPLDPGPCHTGVLEKVHDKGYLDFLKTAWADWIAAGHRGELIPTMFPARRMQQRRPNDIDGKAGYYAMASETAITRGTWRAALSSCACAQAAQRAIVKGDDAAFALCRPPGHHAAIDMFGGYCFLNNAAVAAQMFIDAGAERAAVLDIDFHHGNGTQDIFYERGDVFFASLHGQPEDAFPHFLGYADETGQGAGEGANANFPMPPGTAYDVWSQALDRALDAIRNHGTEALVVSLGTDAFKNDPISFFKLESDDFTDCGRRIAGLGIPAMFVMEGGYAIEAVGINAVNVLEGFLNA
ncbi:histone deacetylase family protein [Tepidamorphus sp. 3E244]|uniref:histone deacetylase family protein n=1 Tax=Tepidamorphus sp. 3E244 TaxID=3385498 RepID=UPI0038FCFFD0